MSNFNKISATFFLRTCDLPLTIGSNSVGSLNDTHRSSMTWSNVDIQSIMGEMWDKYTYFTIILVSAVASSLLFANQVPDLIGIINMQGLQFINSSYSIKSKCRQPSVPVGYVNFKNTSQGTTTTNKSNASVQFQKGQPILDLTLTLNRAVDGTLMQAFLFTNGGGALDGMNPHQIFTFRIEGVE
jgi:hypothetical protein